VFYAVTRIAQNNKKQISNDQLGQENESSLQPKTAKSSKMKAQDPNDTAMIEVN